jgi:hypothetical protein
MTTSASARGQKNSNTDKDMKTTITFFALTAEQLVDNEWKQVYYMYENTVVYEAEKAKRFDTLDEAREFHANIKPSKYTKNEQIQKIQLTIDVKETFSVGSVDTFTKIKQMLAKGGFRKDYTTKEADRSILCCIGYAACKCWNEEWTVKFIKEAADAVDFLDDEEVLNYIREKEGD